MCGRRLYHFDDKLETNLSDFAIRSFRCTGVRLVTPADAAKRFDVGSIGHWRMVAIDLGEEES